ncbi:GPI inositol-deacylase [Euwallacea fornicatus]|uniref:GPI inositol-deacylase n=1 Tax=Euwallacea fornicatus TaxID=995702 RepID=UPI00338EFAA5
MKNIIVYFLISLLATLFYIAGLVFFLTDHERNDKCEMTYMFEYPQYVRIHHELDELYPKYGLYAYGEGRTTKKARNMQFNGIPVVFLPGNAGSHHQVRSLASVALRKALNSGTTFHFDYFTIDLNSEFSAFYGPILYEQLQYVLSSIEKVLELYKNDSRRPRRVVLIGHSVGGIVAKNAIATLVKQNKHLVSIFIALASPLAREPVYFDRYASSFYASSSFNQTNITSVSIAGGYSDILVPTYLTINQDSINLVATNIAKCWVESNHVQILWCKQLVLAINRALFDSVDRNSNQISTDSNFVQKVFRHHLTHNSGSYVDLTGATEKLIKIDYKGDWIENIQRHYTIDLKEGLKQPQWYMVGLTLQAPYQKLSVLAINLEVTDWVFACSAAYPNKASRVCVEAKHLTQYSEIAPSNRHKRRLLTVDLHEIKRRNREFTHVVFRALPTDDHLIFHVDTYSEDEREATVSLPKFSFQKRLLQRTPEKAVVFNLIFPELEDPLQIYQLYLEPVQCDSKEHHSTASLITPWANESVHMHFTELLNKPFILRVQNPKPAGGESVRVQLTLEPSCVYAISVRLHIIGVFGQLARHYSPFIISTCATVFLLAFQSQVNVVGRTKRVPIFFSSLVVGLKEIWLVAAAFLVSLTCKRYLPEPEFYISENAIYTVIAMTIMIMVSYSLIFILLAAYCFSLFALESTAHKLALKLLAKSVTLTFRFSDYFVTFLHKMPFLVAATLIALCFTACGGLALCVGLLFYFLKLTQMSQEYVEQVAWFILGSLARKIRRLLSKRNEGLKEATESTGLEEKSLKSTLTSERNDVSSDERVENSDLETAADGHEGASEETEVEENKEIDARPLEDLTESNNSIFFHSSMFVIWAFVAALNVPAVLTWAHNFKYSRNLSPDESLLPGLIFSIGAFFLWQFDLPRVDRRFSSVLRVIILTLVPISFLYGAVSVYRINYMLTFLFALVLLQQFAPKVATEIGEATDDARKRDAHERYDDIKKKID